MTIREPNVIPNVVPNVVPPLTPPLSTDSVTSNLPTTTTTAPGATPSAPSMQPRPAGWHAGSLGLDWNKRGEQYEYLLKTGLPMLHAAIVNEDWICAAELLRPEALGLCWQPPATQRPPEIRTAMPHSSRWAALLPSAQPESQNKAILDMALDRVGSTSIGDSGCLLGTNLLTLCLLKPAPVEFLAKVVQLAEQHAPQVLDNPDANGRTPLYIAVERGDLVQISLLQEAGADPDVACHFPHADGAPAPSAYRLALAESPTAVFSLLLEDATSTMTESFAYPIEKDPLGLASWVQRHDEAEVLALAEKFPKLRLALSSYEDKTKTSLLCRAIRQGHFGGNGEGKGENAVESIAADPGIDPFITTPSQKSPLEVAAEHGTAATFVSMVQTIQQRWVATDINAALRHALRTFLLSRSEADICQLARECPDIGDILHEVAYDQIILKRNDMSANHYMALVRLIWPNLDETGKSRVLACTAAYTDQRMDAVLGMMDCSLEDSRLQEMMMFAADSGNTAAWEFAADRSLVFNGKLRKLADGDQSAVLTGMVELVLRAGSRRGLDRMMQAGLDLQPHLDFRSELILPLLADLDPAGLALRLKGLRFQVDPNLASTAKTDAGQQALRELITANANANASDG